MRNWGSERLNDLHSFFFFFFFYILSPCLSSPGFPESFRLYFHLFNNHLSTDSLEKTLMLGGIGGKRGRGPQRMRWLDGITDSMDVSEWTPGVGAGQGGLVCCDSWGRKELDMPEWLNWTELNVIKIRKGIELTSAWVWILALIGCNYKHTI